MSLCVHCGKTEEYTSCIRVKNGSSFAHEEGEINKLYKNDEKKLLIELCVFYIKFLVGNPNYRSIIMLDNIEVDDESYSDIESARNFIELELEHYMKINNVSKREARRKSFVIRAIVFEATLLLERGDLENTPENFDFIRYCIARELALV